MASRSHVDVDEVVAAAARRDEVPQNTPQQVKTAKTSDTSHRRETTTVAIYLDLDSSANIAS